MELIRKGIQPGVVALEISGEMRTSGERSRLTQAIDEAIQKNERGIILDLSRLELIDSAGVGTIVLCYSRLRRIGGTLRVAGPKGMVETVLKLTQIHRAIDFFPTVAEAAHNCPPADEKPASSD